MSLKWTAHSESGILRKSECKEKKEDLFVFGYSCKLFRDDEKAQHIDQGKHLIPWMGDETLKIDRYDARGALHDLSSLEAPPGGFDWRIELTRTELDVEQLCDEERYRALHTDEDEEEMYKEEELKRLHAAGYGQVGFNYDAPKAPEQPPQPAEVDEPFVPTPSFKALFSPDIVMPESEKQNAIIEKTAKFIASQGAQMEILIKTKQTDNPQFKFLNRDSALHSYYTALTALIKAGKWPEKKPEIIEEKPPEPDEYLHPSLASTIIESAPSIPSIQYRPSADCDYSMLVWKMRGESPPAEAEAPAPGEEPPPGTAPLPPRAAHFSSAPLMYNHHDVPPPAPPSQQDQYAAYYAQYRALQILQQEKKPENHQKPPSPVKTTVSTGLSLMKNYNTDSETDDSDSDTSSTDSKEQIAMPPEDVQLVIDKMAAYVARNGDEFAEIVRAKNDPRFTFLEPDNVYHVFYRRLMQEKRGVAVNGKERDKPSRAGAPLSFSIKKLKGPDPILPKPALPYESSSDDDSEKQTDKPEDKEPAKTTAPPTFPVQNMPPVVVYKMEATVDNELPIVKTFEAKVVHPAPVVKEIEKKVEETPKVENKVENNVPHTEILKIEEVKESEVQVEKVVQEEKKEVEVKIKEKVRERSPRKEKRKHKDRKKEYRSKSVTREVRKERRSLEREERRDRKREKEDREKRHKNNKEDLENEIISLDDNSDDLVDLTGDLSDSKGSGDCETERIKQQERRRRAAEFLKRVGVEPSAAIAMPANSLASAMVDTLESIRKKKAEEDERRRRRDKKRHRDRYSENYEDGAEKSHRKSKRRRYKSSEEEESDFDGSKKKKRKKEKKHKNKKRRRREADEEERGEDHPLNIDLSSTLKELRTASPTKQLELQDVQEDSQFSMRQESSSSEEEKMKKNEREYSEGEWSSDSEQDSESEHSRVG